MELAAVVFGILLMDIVGLSANVGDATRVRTAFGDIVGRIGEVVFNKDVFKVQKYLGIPYAEPPISDLRYKKPVPKKFSNNTVVNATKIKDTCIQLNSAYHEKPVYKQSEDCLFLNVYVPHDKSNSSKYIPVLLWIHGGLKSADFSDGASNYLNGDVLSVAADVIVVTFNYRLSFYGFLSTRDSRAVGNLGLWDQQLVIEWVREHIRSFGGDRNRITLLGQDQGAVSAILQSLYPGNRGMFQKIIAEDGTPFGLSSWQLYPFIVASQSIPKIIDVFNCNSVDINKSVECLLKMKSEKVKRILGSSKSDLHFLPVIDHSFILSSAEEMVAKYIPEENSGFDLPFTDVDILIGSNRQCGVYNNLHHLHGENFRAFRAGVNSVTESLFGRWSPEIIYKVIVALYSNVEIPTDNKRFLQRFIRFNQDGLTYVPLSKTALTHAENSVEGMTFLYHNRMEGQSCVTGKTLVTEGTKEEILNSVRPMTNKESGGILSTYENTTPSLKLMRWWGNFARFGQPIIVDDSAWYPFDPNNQTYMDLSSGTIHSLKDDPISEFWLDVIPAMFNETFGEKVPKGHEMKVNDKVTTLESTNRPDISESHANAVIIALAAVILILCAGLAILGGFILCLKVKQARITKI